MCFAIWRWILWNLVQVGVHGDVLATDRGDEPVVVLDAPVDASVTTVDLDGADGVRVDLRVVDGGPGGTGGGGGGVCVEFEVSEVLIVRVEG